MSSMTIRICIRVICRWGSRLLMILKRWEICGSKFSRRGWIWSKRLNRRLKAKSEGMRLNLLLCSIHSWMKKKNLNIDGFFREEKNWNKLNKLNTIQVILVLLIQSKNCFSFQNGLCWVMEKWNHICTNTSLCSKIWKKKALGWVQTRGLECLNTLFLIDKVSSPMWCLTDCVRTEWVPRPSCQRC